ncbi:MAG: VIT1/CCC1 transporter family protein [Bacteriovoracaceae bacterium]|nr:VIT1/CCC1 transporter family protein [Bacteriovoracaceae bacterium]
MTKKKNRFPRALYHSHKPEDIVRRLQSVKAKSYIKDFVYGAIDGTVTTFAIVAGVIGAQMPNYAILILGAANILADGFSMAASNYLGTKTEIDQLNLLFDFESEQIKNDPQGEKEEIRQIYKAKGLRGEVLDFAVENIVKDREKWLSTMLQEEYGLSGQFPSAFKAAIMTFIAFIIFGMVPLAPYIILEHPSFLLTSILTGVAFFSVGCLKSRWSLESAWLSGLKTLAIGTMAAALAYYTGKSLNGLMIR